MRPSPVQNLQDKRNNELDILRNNADVMGRMIQTLEGFQSFLRLQSSYLVNTLDTVVYEHMTVELPTNQAYYSLALPPQTRQMERIDTVFAAIVFPALPNGNPVTAPTITLDNAYAMLGEQYVNLNAILNSSGGTGGAIPTPLGILLNEHDVRTFNIHATANFPQGAYLTAFCTGQTIPATLGEANV